MLLWIQPLFYSDSTTWDLKKNFHDPNSLSVWHLLLYNDCPNNDITSILYNLAYSHQSNQDHMWDMNSWCSSRRRIRWSLVSYFGKELGCWKQKCGIFDSIRCFFSLCSNMVYNYTIPRGPIAPMFSSPGPAYKLPGLVGQPGHDPRSVHEKKPAYPFGMCIC